MAIRATGYPFRMTVPSGSERIAAALPPREFIRFPIEETEQSLADRFEAQVRRVPERVAVKTRRDELTYAQLNARANRVAGAVSSASEQRAAPVVILVEQGAALVAATVGVLKAGRPYVGLDPHDAFEGLRRTLEHCGADLIVTNERNRALAVRLAASRCSLIDVDSPGASCLSTNPGVRRSPDDPAYIYYTSGSTGVPKGVVDVQRNVLHNVMRYTNHLRISETDRLTLLQSMAFSGAVSSLFCALLNGAACFPIDMREEGSEGLAAWIVDQELTVYHSVPSIFQRLLATGVALPSLRVIRLEGDQVTRRHVDLFQSHFGPEVALVNGLGATETGISHQYPIRTDTVIAGSVVPVGYATADMQALILDDSGTELPAGGVGEIAIRSRYLATGYWRQPDLTAARFLSAPSGGGERIYRTGDLGRLGPDGCLEYLGRSDRSLKLHGRWVDVHAIELALVRDGGVRDAIVLVRETGDGAQELVAYVVPATGSVPKASALRCVLTTQPGNLAVPSRYVWLDALPLDANGKVRRTALPDPDASRPDLATPFVAPDGGIETALAEIWCRVLKLDRIGVHDDFSELGGDSLQAIAIADEVERRLGVVLPGSFLLEATCIAEMARRLGLRDPGRATLVPITPGRTGRPFFCMHDGTGDVIAYRELARRLGPDQAVFGLRAAGLDGSDAPLERVEAMAKRYVAEIRQVQPAGPYCLGGNCFGGVIAFEVARQLRAAGETVGLVALIDTGYPVGEVRSKVQRHLHRLSRMTTRGKAAHLAALSRRILKRLAGRLRRAASSRTRRGGDESTSPVDPVLAANFRAEWRYRPSRCDVPVVLVYAGRPHNHLGWRKVIPRTLRCVALPDDPGDNHIVQPPNVGPLAEVLGRLLRESQTSPRTDLPSHEEP